MALLFILLGLLVIGLVGILVVWFCYVVKNGLLNKEESILMRIGSVWLLALNACLIAIIAWGTYQFLMHNSESEQTVTLGMNSWQCTTGHTVWIPYERIGKVTREAHSEFRCDQYDRKQ